MQRGKTKKKEIGINGTEAGAKWNSNFLCNDWIIFIKRRTG